MRLPGRQPKCTWPKSRRGHPLPSSCCPKQVRARPDPVSTHLLSREHHDQVVTWSLMKERNKPTSAPCSEVPYVAPQIVDARRAEAALARVACLVATSRRPHRPCFTQESSACHGRMSTTQATRSVCEPRTSQLEGQEYCPSRLTVASPKPTGPLTSSFGRYHRLLAHVVRITNLPCCALCDRHYAQPWQPFTPPSVVSDSFLRRFTTTEAQTPAGRRER